MKKLLSVVALAFFVIAVSACQRFSEDGGRATTHSVHLVAKVSSAIVPGLPGTPSTRLEVTACRGATGCATPEEWTLDSDDMVDVSTFAADLGALAEDTWYFSATYYVEGTATYAVTDAEAVINSDRRVGIWLYEIHGTDNDFTNHAPVAVAQVQDFSVPYGTEVNLEAQFDDADSDDLTVNWVIDGQSVPPQFTPPPTRAGLRTTVTLGLGTILASGDHDVVVIVSDPAGAMAGMQFGFTVGEPTVDPDSLAFSAQLNALPRVTSVAPDYIFYPSWFADFTLYSGDTIPFLLTAEDQEGDTLTATPVTSTCGSFLFAGQPWTGAEELSSCGCGLPFEFIPNGISPCTIEMDVSDGHGSVHASFTFDVVAPPPSEPDPDL